MTWSLKKKIYIICYERDTVYIQLYGKSNNVDYITIFVSRVQVNSIIKFKYIRLYLKNIS